MDNVRIMSDICWYASVLHYIYTVVFFS